MSIYINSYNMISCLGSGTEDHKQIFEAKSGLTPDKLVNGKNTFSGKIASELSAVPDHLQKWNSRNNELLLTVIEPLISDIEKSIADIGTDRFGIVAGTSTSGMSNVEKAFEVYNDKGSFPKYYDYRQHEMGSPSEFLKEFLGVNGPAYTVSCACSSGAKALAAAARLIENDICDVVLAGGVDTLCNLTLSGFGSLEVISEARCNPFSKNRDGISIGEAGAFFLLSKDHSEVQFLAAGESSDAHHHSAPHPEGKGARAAMEKALENAALTASDIDYINLHGTGTLQNDAMEAKAVFELFGGEISCSSTKSFTGHTLGAAGALEAAFCCLSLEEGKTPIHLWDGKYDDNIPSLNFSRSDKPPKKVLSNSFAFGGSNCAVILGVSND